MLKGRKPIKYLVGNLLNILSIFQFPPNRSIFSPLQKHYPNKNSHESSRNTQLNIKMKINVLYKPKNAQL